MDLKPLSDALEKLRINQNYYRPDETDRANGAVDDIMIQTDHGSISLVSENGCDILITAHDRDGVQTFETTLNCLEHHN